MKPRAVVIGLDGLAPVLAFDRLRAAMPTLARLAGEGAWGPLASVDPPVTVPAWSCAFSGLSAGQLGLYGFRHRPIGRYDGAYLARADAVRRPRVWDLLGAAGGSAGLLAVPQTWPIAPPAHPGSWVVGDFLATGGGPPLTWPAALEAELAARVGPWRADVEGFRSEDRERVLADILAVSRQRFAALRHLIATRPTDLVVAVDMAPDRAHHAFWRWLDPAHPRHEPGHRLAGAIARVYGALDAELAATLRQLGEAGGGGLDDVHVLVVSDHGARALEGGFCLNSWLIARGDLRLAREVRRVRPFDESLVDWPRTRAWAWGGYHGRVFVNVAGREPQGIVAPAEVEGFLARLAADLEALPGPDGRPAGHRVLRPRDLAPAGVPPAGDAPDLLVYPGDLRLRAIGSIGHPGLYTETNDTGPDEANHDRDGVLVWRGPGVRPGRRDGLRLVDLGPTLLALLGLAAPADAAGRAIAPDPAAPPRGPQSR